MEIERTMLLEVLKRLPVGVFLVGDAAYTLQDRVLRSFCRVTARPKAHGRVPLLLEPTSQSNRICFWSVD